MKKHLTHMLLLVLCMAALCQACKKEIVTFYAVAEGNDDAGNKGNVEDVTESPTVYF